MLSEKLMEALLEACRQAPIEKTRRLRAKEGRADELCKGAVGAWVGHEMAAGHPVVIACVDSLLAGLSHFLAGDKMREAVLGCSGKGSEAFHRVYGSQKKEPV